MSQGEFGHWETIISDVAEAEIEDAYNSIVSVFGTERATAWVHELHSELLTLGDFPGPYRYAIYENAMERSGREVRRMLFRGPKRKPIPTVYRAFYLLTPPQSSEESGVIYIIRFVPGGVAWPDSEIHWDTP